MISVYDNWKELEQNQEMNKHGSAMRREIINLDMRSEERQRIRERKTGYVKNAQERECGFHRIEEKRRR